METRTIGPFRLDRELGAGGMGVVYGATYLKTGKQVALKVLPPAMSANEKLVARFEREMAILKKLKHPNIVPYYGGWKHEGQHFYAMKLMTGGTIEEQLKKSRRIPWRETIEYGFQICQALEYAHDCGIVHRDLKPGNLFLTEDGRLCLGDFGIARDLDATALTAAGFTVGTYAYMAPEQITGRAPVTHKTDLYALGCVMFEMLTSRTPYHGQSQADLLFQHVQSDVPRVSDFVDDCPELLDDLVTRLLQKDAADRPHDAAFVHYMLDDAQKKISASIRAETRVQDSMTAQDVHPELTKLIQKKPKRKKRKKKETGSVYERTWFLGLCLALLVGSVTWAMWPASEQELFLEAKKLMETDDPVQWQQAKDQYLTPLLERFPEGEYAEQAQEYVDKLEMHRAERRARTNARLGREPQSEAERLYLEAWHFEQFGDRVTAIEKYRSMAELLKDRPDDRSYVHLAKRQIHTIEAQGSTTTDRVAIVNNALTRANDLFAKGQVLEARKIWNSIVTLYGSYLEFEPQVAQAHAKLAGKSADAPGQDEVSDSASPSTSNTPHDSGDHGSGP